MTLGTILLLSGCSGVNNTPYDPTKDDEQEINYTVEEEVTFTGEIESIDGNKIILDDGTIVRITENIILTGNHLTFVVSKLT